MLSRVAERMYWFGRYIERAENTARLINVNANVLLDLPKMTSHIWESLIDISGSNEEFYNKFGKADERNTIKFMIADDSNPGSILMSIRMARENARTTREIIPNESWEAINELYLLTKQQAGTSSKREGRQVLLDNIINRCHQLTGLIANTMSHGEAYKFKRIGANLERADMTTRIIDVGCLNLLSRKEGIPEAFNNILWMNVLRSLSAYQMYKQYVRDRVNGEDVVAFLLQDDEFPRALACCLLEMNQSVQELPKNDLVLRSISRLQRILVELDIEKLFNARLHEFIDELQVDLAIIHSHVSQTWFDYTSTDVDPDIYASG